MKKPVLTYALLSMGLLMLSGISVAQNPAWMYWDPWTCTIPSRYLSDIDIDAQGKKWIGTEPVCGGGICTDGGLAVFDGYTWLVYDSLNSTLNSNFIGAVHIDENNIVWVGTKYGEVSSYDGNAWEAHPFPNTENVPVFSITSDLYGYVWAATGGKGLYMFDGSEWEQYHSGNSILTDYVSSVVAGPDNAVWAGGNSNLIYKYTGDWNSIALPDELYFTSTIAIDHENRVWVGSEGAFCQYFGGTWTVFDETLTGIPDSAIGYIFDIAFDYSGNTWIGHSDGLIKYDGAEWTTYRPDNSGMLSEHVQSLVADELGNLWIGTADTGLIAYQEGGVVKTEDRRTSNEQRAMLLNPFPNPASKQVSIEYELSEASYIHLSIIDINGCTVAVLKDETQKSGSYHISWDITARKGIYSIYLQTPKQQFSQKLIIY